MDDVPYYDYSAAGVIIDGAFGDDVETDVKLAHHINKHVEDKAIIDRLTAELDTMTLAIRSLEARVASLESYAPSVSPGKRLRSSSHDEAGPSDSVYTDQELTDVMIATCGDSKLPELLDVDALPYQAPAPEIPQQAPPSLHFIPDDTLDAFRSKAMGPDHKVRFGQLTAVYTGNGSKGGNTSGNNALHYAFVSCVKEAYRGLIPFKGSVENMTYLLQLSKRLKTEYTAYWTSRNVEMCCQIDGRRDGWNVYPHLRDVIAFDVIATLLRDADDRGL
jgi:hypothetical protein